MSVNENLARLNISLPAITPPTGPILLFVQTGNLLFVSGHIAKKDGVCWEGQLGKNTTTTEGREAARLIAIDLMTTMQAALGDLNRVRRIVKLLVLVNSAPDFTEQHLVAHGATDLLREVFGDKALHARSAIGVAQLPLGSCVEIELIAEVE